jgi:hypothetical protein
MDQHARCDVARAMTISAQMVTLVDDANLMPAFRQVAPDHSARQTGPHQQNACHHLTISKAMPLRPDRQISM